MGSLQAALLAIGVLLLVFGWFLSYLFAFMALKIIKETLKEVISPSVLGDKTGASFPSLIYMKPDLEKNFQSGDKEVDKAKILHGKGQYL